MSNAPRLLTAATLIASLTATAAWADSVSTTGSTTIIQPVTIAKTADMAFGSIVRPATGSGVSGTVTLPNNSDTVSVSAGLVALSGTTNHAKYTISGEGAQTVAITVPDSFDLTSGENTLTVELDPSLGATTVLSGSLGTTGTASLAIGGAFEVDEDTPSGAYTGTFNVAVNYQ